MARRSATVGPWLVLGWLTTHCGLPAPESLVHSGQTIVNGTTDAAAAHQGVVLLYFPLTHSLCTGTLISPNVVLTAAHCTQGVTKDQVHIGFGPDEASAEWVTATRIWTNPGYDPTLITGDIGLIQLAQVPAGVTPIPFLPAAESVQPAEVGSSMVLVGYGLTDPANPDSAGIRMKATNTLDWVCTEQNPSDCTLGGMYLQTPKKTLCFDRRPTGSGGVCNGDSGGPALLTRDGHEHVAGVTSFGDVDCLYFGCHTKVDAYESAILAFAGAPNGTGCAEGLSCQSGYCQNAVCCDSACAGPCRVCNQAGSVGTCLALPEGLSCADNDVCNGVEVCHAGVCAGAALNCADGDPCTLDRCDAITGCHHQVAPDGSSCSDGNACNGTESCASGACLPGTAPVCQDENPCTEDRCDSVVGCLFMPVQNGTDCSDSDPCNGVERCAGGRCVIADDDPCGDGEPCTEDRCDGILGCVHLALEDGADCGKKGHCRQGVCAERKSGSGSSGCATGPSEPIAADFPWLVLLLLAGFRIRSPYTCPRFMQNRE